jgi:septal ring factor EnvC (AmiA/AmiB activator)
MEHAMSSPSDEHGQNTERLEQQIRKQVERDQARAKQGETQERQELQRQREQQQRQEQAREQIPQGGPSDNGPMIAPDDE